MNFFQSERTLRPGQCGLKAGCVLLNHRKFALSVTKILLETRFTKLRTMNAFSFAGLYEESQRYLCKAS